MCNTPIEHRNSVKMLDDSFLFFFSGDPVLHASMAMERMGGWQDSCFNDGS